MEHSGATMPVTCWGFVLREQAGMTSILGSREMRERVTVGYNHDDLVIFFSKLINLSNLFKTHFLEYL